MTKSNLKGFTLIELLIVIVIIGILAVALIPRLTGAQATARDTARKAILQQNASIIASYYGQETSPGNFPATLTSGSALATTLTTLPNYGNFATKDAQNKDVMVIAGNQTSAILCVNMEKAGAGNGSAANCAAITTPAQAEAALTGAVTATSQAYLVKVSY